MSPSSEAEVVLPAALHARPAAEVVRVAAGFRATVEVRHGDRSAPARSALRLMSLGAKAGATVTVHAAGDDAAGAVEAVAAALRLTK
ncbi:HPr family phosphocarrier protein [Actinoplanes regularis]|uniref:HPr family phosphocarrier protein n=1 Tax=Actinoplanes regularis TaxID=52697 RepID=UPI002556B2BA|nr:HPr family phosphocarrier protein [Actinoplanes regularis]GLW31683.1 hypothetical protein Areg01_46230 [Actinoplanes regularis]